MLQKPVGVDTDAMQIVKAAGSHHAGNRLALANSKGKSGNEMPPGLTGIHINRLRVRGTPATKKPGGGCGPDRRAVSKKPEESLLGFVARDNRHVLARVSHGK